MPLRPGCRMATLTARGIQLYSEYTLTLKVGVCIVTTKALGMLAHVATLGARLRRRDQPGEHALVASDGRLELTKRVDEELLLYESNDG